MILHYRAAVPASLVRALAALLGVLAAVLVATSFQARPAAATTCTDSLQAKINAAPSGGTVPANPCIYREQVVIGKPITLQGQQGTEIRGSDVWTGFTLRNGVYTSTKTVPGFSANGQCKPNTSDCLKPEQVFFDGKPLKQVADGTAPSTGQFSLDAGRHVVLKDNPAGHTVEVSVRREWVHGASPNVTIKGFTMKHAANDSQWRAPLKNNGNNNWTLQDSVLSDSHGALVSFGGASGLKIANNELYRGGQLGVHGSDGSVAILGNKIHDNNASGFDPNWEAGGVKTARMTNVLAQNNQVWNNDGTGLWCDINCYNATFRGNRVHHNAYSGILFELSNGAKISYNVLHENGWGKTGSAVGSWQAAVHVTNSRNAEVWSNTVAWNRSNISLVRTNRNNATWNDVYGNYVHDNQVLSKDYPSSASYDSTGRTHALAWSDSYDGKMCDPAKNNRGFSNDYYYATSENPTIPRYKWCTKGLSSLSSFNATPGEEQGRYLSQSQKDALVASKGIPANPEH